VSAIAELAKLPAFARRDLLGARRRRAAFAGDLLALAGQVVVLYFVGRLIDPSELPAYGGERATFIEFVTIGLAVSLAITVTVRRCATALRQEQLNGTLEALLATPAAVGTVHLGSLALDLLWLPLRVGMLVAAAVVLFGLDYELSGIGTAAALLAAVLPFALGLGLIGGAVIVRYRLGTGGLGVLVGVLVVCSGAYFPLSLLPDWLEATGDVNPVAVALEGIRGSLMGAHGWDAVMSDLAILLPASALSLTIGAVLFHAAIARELRRGTLTPA